MPTTLVHVTILEGIVVFLLAALLLGALAMRREVRRRSADADLFQQILETAREGIWLIDADGRTTYANRRMAEMLGVTPDEMSGRSMYDFTDEAARAEAERNLGRRREGIVEQHDFRFRRRDGSDLWTICSTSPVFDEKQNFVGALAVITDVSDRKAADDALQEGEERFRNLIEGSIQGIAILRDGKPLFANRAYAEIFGYAGPDEVLALDSMDRHIAPHERKRVLGYRAARRRGDPVPARYEYQAVRKDGRPVWLENSPRIVTWKGRPAVQQVIVDITERKEAEAALRASEDRYRRLVEHAPDAIMVHCEGKIVFANRAAADLLGAATPSGLIGIPALSLVPERDRDFVRERIRRVAEGGEVVPFVEERLVRLDGALVEVEALGIPFPYGDRTAVQVTFRDMTERKRDEDQLRLLLTLNSVIANAPDFDSALGTALRTLGEKGNWAYGETWIPRADGSALESGPVWHVESESLETYRKGSRAFRFGPNEGLPGRVWTSGRPEWVPDLTGQTAPGFPRVDLIRKAGLRTGFAVPILVDGRAIAVLSFKAFRCREKDERFVGIVEAVAAHLGSLLQRKQMEERLRQSEERFRHFAESTSDWLWEQDENLRFTWLSSAVEEKSGLPVDAHIGKTRWEVVDRGVTEEQWRRHRADLEARRPFRDFQFQRVGQDGKVRTISVSGAPVFDERGNFKGYRGTATDKTREVEARRRAEQAEARLRDAIESMPASLILYDANERLVLCNTQAKTLLPEVADVLVPGVAVRNLTRIRFERLYPDKSPGEIEEMLQTRLRQFRKTGAPQLERHPDGRWMQFFERRTSDGGTVCVRIDITDVKRGEEALRRSERTLSTLMSNLPGVVYRCRNDRDWTMEFLSAGTETLTGHRPEQISENKRISFADLIHPDDRERIWKQVQDALQKNRPFQLTYRIITADNQTKWVWEQGRCVSPPGETPQILEGFITDITERKHMEEELRQAQKIQALGALAGGIAHDFNNVLVPMIGLTKMAAKMAEPDSPIHQNLEGVLEASNRAKALVDQILAFSRHSDPERKPVDIGEIVTDALKLLRSTIPTTIEIRHGLAPDIGLIVADPTQIHQVLMNLGANAAQAIGPHPGVIEVTVDRVDIGKVDALKHRKLNPGSYVRLAVKDNGAGMDPATVERVFEPFFTTKPVGEGSGMGLAVVHGIVSGHGGAITVSSEPGKGTIFELYFPTRESALAANTKPGSPCAPVPAESTAGALSVGGSQ